MDKASVSTAGTVTGVASGDAVVTATSEGKSATASVVVSPVPVARVALQFDDLAMPLGGTQALVARTWDDLNQELFGRHVWLSTDKPNVVSIDPDTRVITAVAAGTATITAHSEAAEKAITVTVVVPVASVEVVTALDTLEASDVLPMAAITRDANDNLLLGRVITWTSSNPAVATINAGTGVLTGVDRGKVTITATSEGKSGTATRVVVIKYRSISAGTMHACDIASGGIVWCWGLNGAEGRIGDANMANGAMSAVPVRVPGNSKFTQISTFGRHTCGVTTEGKAWCWGTNSWGSLGNGTNIAATFTPVAVAGGHTFRKVTVGSDHSCGITITSRAYCWGNNDWRQLGTGNSTVSNVPVPVNIVPDILDIEAGAAFTCAVSMAANGYCWGSNSIGQVGDGKQISYGNVFVSLPSQVVGGLAWKQVDVAQQYACALTVAGAAYCWGSNNGKFGNGPGSDASTPQPVSGGITFQRISTGFGHACGIAADNAVWCWGSSGNGQLGVAGTHSTVPVRAAENMLAAEVAAAGIGTGSGAHTCAISEDRLTVKCWGRNDVGQLGNGLTTTQAAVNFVPAIVTGQEPLPPNN